MPYIRFEAGQLTPAVRQQLIRELTETSARIMGIPTDYFFVAVHELPNENIAIAGKDVNQLKAEIAARTPPPSTGSTP